MNETKLTTIGQIREFLAGTTDVPRYPEDDDKARDAFICSRSFVSATGRAQHLLPWPG